MFEFLGFGKETPMGRKEDERRFAQGDDTLKKEGVVEISAADGDAITRGTDAMREKKKAELARMFGSVSRAEPAVADTKSADAEIAKNDAQGTVSGEVVDTDATAFEAEQRLREIQAQIAQLRKDWKNTPENLVAMPQLVREEKEAEAEVARHKQ